MENEILDLLAQGAMKSGEVAEKTGLDKKDVDKTIKKLIAEDKVFSPKRCFYEAKKQSYYALAYLKKP